MHDKEIYTQLNEIILTHKRLKRTNFGGEEGNRFLKTFRYCLTSLKEDYRLIMIESYFECSYQFWWVDYFCKSSYYRKRYWAIISFVRLFNIIYENFDYYSTFNSALN